MAKCCGQEGYERGRPQHDRRLQLIDDIKQLIGDMDSQERSKTQGGGKKTGSVNIPGVRNMDEECLQYRRRRECSPPTITSIATHEIRPTSMYDSMKYESHKRLTYVDATSSTDPWDPMPPAPWELPRTPSQELRAGTLYMSCDCRKRNGLQHDCQRKECGGQPTCLAVNPGPCCEPSKARKPVRGDRRHGGSGVAQLLPDSQIPQSSVPPTSGAKGPPPAGATGRTPGANGGAPTMVCVCAPVAPAAPAATPQAARQEFIAGPSQAPPPSTCNQGQCYLGASPGPRPPPTGGQFVAVSPTGGKFLCCPMPS